LTDGEAGWIAEALGDLPLALAQAEAHLADTANGVQGYLALLAERTTELLAQGAPATYPVSLAASAQIALDQLAAQSPAALVLLSLAAYLAPEPIPMTLFTTHPAPLPDSLATVAGDPLAFVEVTRLLRHYGLARVETATVQLHRLLAAILRTQPHQQQDLPIVVIRLLRAAVPADHPWDNPSVWPAWRQLLPHVLIATSPHRTLTGVTEDVAWLLNRAGLYLQTRGETLRGCCGVGCWLGLRSPASAPARCLSAAGASGRGPGWSRRRHRGPAAPERRRPPILETISLPGRSGGSC
jgi:hypothetical protein